MQKSFTRLSFEPVALSCTAWCKFLFFHLSPRMINTRSDARAILVMSIALLCWMVLYGTLEITSRISFCRLSHHVSTLSLFACQKNIIVNSRHSNSIDSRCAIMEKLQTPISSSLKWWALIKWFLRWWYTLLFIFCVKCIFKYWVSLRCRAPLVLMKWGRRW